MKNKKEIPSKTQKLIYQEADSACAFCGERDVNALEIHHIDGRAQGGSNEPENLILVCSNCHSKITNGGISEADILRTKLMLLSGKKRGSSATTPLSSTIHMEDSVNTGVIASILNIRTSKRSSVKVNPPNDTIAADRDKRNYIKHLIDRYIDFKKADRNIDEFKDAIIYNSIKTKFKSKWDFIPTDKFEDLAVYLQNRIDGTILGKARKSKGQRNYSTFEEFLKKQKGDGQSQ